MEQKEVNNNLIIKISIILCICFLVMLGIVLIHKSNTYNSDVQKYIDKEKESPFVYLDNYKIIESIYGTECRNNYSYGIKEKAITSEVVDSDIVLLYKPASDEKGFENIELQDGYYDLKSKKIGLKSYFYNQSINNIYEYKDNSVSKVVSYSSSSDEGKEEIERVKEEERKYIYDNLVSYNGKCSGKKVNEMLKFIFCYYSKHEFDTRGELPEVNLNIYDWWNGTFRYGAYHPEYTNLEMTKGSINYAGRLRTIYECIQDDKNYIVTIGEEDNCIKDIKIEYRVKSFLLFKERYKK